MSTQLLSSFQARLDQIRAAEQAEAEERQRAEQQAHQAAAANEFISILDEVGDPHVCMCVHACINKIILTIDA